MPPPTILRPGTARSCGGPGIRAPMTSRPATFKAAAMPLREPSAEQCKRNVPLALRPPALRPADDVDARVGLERLGDPHRSVGLLVVLQQRHDGPADGDG